MRPFILILSVVGLLAAPIAPAAAAAPYCGITWGSQPVTLPTHGEGGLVDVRTGRHECFDRVVFDIEGARPSALVRYADQITTDGEGAVVPLHGGAFLEVVSAVVPGAPDSDDLLGCEVGDEMADVAGYRTLREVAYAGFFEGQVTIGIGVRARLPYRVFTLPGPGTRSRLVIDVAHRW